MAEHRWHMPTVIFGLDQFAKTVGRQSTKVLAALERMKMTIISSNIAVPPHMFIVRVVEADDPIQEKAKEVCGHEIHFVMLMASDAALEEIVVLFMRHPETVEAALREMVEEARTREVLGQLRDGGLEW